jgi:PAS domain S-box-containing protein
MTEHDNPINILLIEDDPADAQLVREILNKTTELFEIIHVTRLETGLERLSENKFDIVLLDLSLPGSFGLETFARMNTEVPHIPIVILSGSGNERLAIKLVQEGAQDYLIKGHVDGSILTRAIHYAIKRKQIDRALRDNEEALREYKARIEGIMRLGNIAWWEIDIPTGSVTFNAQKAKMLGYAPDQFSVYQDFTALLHPDDYEQTMQAMRDCLAGDNPIYDTDYRIKTKAGTYRWFHDIGSVTSRDEDGTPLKLTGVVQDVTEYKETARALRRERDLVAQLMDTSPVSITMVNREGEIIFANARAEEILGLTRDEIVQRTYNAPEWRITDFEGGTFPEEDLPFRQVVNTKQPVYNVRHAIEWPDGHRRLLSINAAPLFDEAGRVERVIFAIEDITKSVEAEQAHLAQLKRELQSLEQIASLPGTRVSARAFGLIPLREHLPNVFETLVERYANLMDIALERRAYKTEENHYQREVRALAERLGSLGGGPRDVVDIHIAAFTRKRDQSNPRKTEAYAEEGRLIALEIMGDLVSYYRTRCVYVNPPAAPYIDQETTPQE